MANKAWESLGGPVTSGAAAASWGMQEIQVFAIRDDGELWSRYWDGDYWHEWHSHGGQFSGQPAASARDADRIDVFAIDAGGTLLHLQWNGEKWLPWEKVEGAPSNARAVTCSWSGERLDLFVWTQENELSYSQFTKR